jgi:hypothetical protein
LVVFIFIKRLLQRQSRILQGREKSSWREDVKKEWENVKNTKKKENVHVTNAEKWICSCYAFLLSQWPCTITKRFRKYVVLLMFCLYSRGKSVSTDPDHPDRIISSASGCMYSK